MMICCPLTTRIKGYPLEVFVPGEPPSAILADQIKCLDWGARWASRMGAVDATVLGEAQAKIRALLGL